MRTVLFAVAAAAILTGCGGGDVPNGQGAQNVSAEYKPYPYAPAISEELKTEYLDAVNEARSEGRYCGDKWFDAAPPLKWDDRLYHAAYEHANDMAETGHYEHEGSGTESDWTANVLGLGRGSTPNERGKVNGMKWGAGENIDCQQETYQGAVEDWLWSPGHCANIMNGDIKTFAAAGKKAKSDNYGIFWVQTFSYEDPQGN